MPYPHMPANPTGGTPVVSLTNSSGGLIAAGTPVYSSAAGSCAPAIATAAASALIIGLVTADSAIGAPAIVQTSDTLVLTTAQWDARTGGAGGLTFGLPYYLDVTNGKISATSLDPTNPANVGKFVVLLGVALSTTQLRLLIQPPIGL